MLLGREVGVGQLNRDQVASLVRRIGVGEVLRVLGQMVAHEAENMVEGNDLRTVLNQLAKKIEAIPSRFGED